MKILKNNNDLVFIERDDGTKVYFHSDGWANTNTSFTAERLLTVFANEDWEVVYETPKPKKYTVDEIYGLWRVIDPNGDPYLHNADNEEKAQKIADALNQAEGL